MPPLLICYSCATVDRQEGTSPGASPAHTGSCAIKTFPRPLIHLGNGANYTLPTYMYKPWSMKRHGTSGLVLTTQTSYWLEKNSIKHGACSVVLQQNIAQSLLKFHPLTSGIRSYHIPETESRVSLITCDVACLTWPLWAPLTPKIFQGYFWENTQMLRV